MSEHEPHELADIFPEMGDLEFQRLVSDMKDHGYDGDRPILLYEGKILDGRHRLRAASEAGVEPEFEQFEGTREEALAKVRRLNLNHRHMTTEQKAAVGAKLKEHYEESARERQGERTDLTQKFEEGEGGEAAEKAAEDVGTNRQYVHDADRIRDEAPDVYERMKGGEYGSMAEAKRAASLPEGEREEVHRRISRGEADEVSEAQRQIRKERNEDKKDTVNELQQRGEYRCLVVDPPWDVEKIERDVRPRQVGFDYPTMSVDEMRDLPVGSLAADDAHLYLWTTHKYLPDALNLVDDWGFRYQCLMTWSKNVGMTPFSWMYSTEHVIFARRGSLDVEEMGLRLDFEADVREHSRKPDVFYERVLQVTPEPRIELFAREDREGFEVWGNESTLFEDE